MNVKISGYFSLFVYNSGNKNKNRKKRNWRLISGTILLKKGQLLPSQMMTPDMQKVTNNGFMSVVTEVMSCHKFLLFY